MAVSTLTAHRTLSRPRRLDGRVLVGLALLLAATGGWLVVWSGLDDARPVLVATRDLPAGATLASSDLAVAQVRLDDALHAAAVPADRLEGLVGHQLAAPVHARQILVGAQLAGRPRLAPGQMAVTIPASTRTAAGGLIRPGDQVRIFATLSKGKPESRTVVVLDRVTVYEVGHDDQPAVVGAAVADTGTRRPLASLTLILDDDAAAAALTQARWNGELDAALLPPEPR
jgi:Flp pilus assembly protein CpaB